MDKGEKYARVYHFILRVIKLYQRLKKDSAGEIIGRQLLRSASSVGANYRAACHAKSSADFLSKIKICEEEADESEYWLSLLSDSAIIRSKYLPSLLNEAHEIAALMASAAKTMRQKNI